MKAFKVIFLASVALIRLPLLLTVELSTVSLFIVTSVPESVSMLTRNLELYKYDYCSTLRLDMVTLLFHFPPTTNRFPEPVPEVLLPDILMSSISRPSAEMVVPYR